MKAKSYSQNACEMWLLLLAEYDEKGVQEYKRLLARGRHSLGMGIVQPRRTTLIMGWQP